MAMIATVGLHFDSHFFWTSLLHPSSAFLQGLWATVYLSVVAQFLATVLGLVIALARRSKLSPVRALAWGYTWIMRGTPLLVQLALVYFGLAAAGIYRFSNLTVGPVTIPGEVQAAIFTFTLNEAAYMGEIIRAALGAVDPGQLEAAMSTGMTPARAMQLVVVPQAVRFVIPPLGNDFNAMMKNTSLASIIGVQELFLVSEQVSSVTFNTFEIYLVASLYYLALTTVWSVIQAVIERRIDRKWGIERTRWRRSASWSRRWSVIDAGLGT
ncbi:MAG TPA: amino acid ABC transporter permease [Acidimicrobiales bacterium]|nr:amino acid ABC transporter permease [Acidimicrobiales bacterium]